MLSRIVEWYNEIKEKTVSCEFNIIQKDVELIDNKLQIALNTATWSDYDQSYIYDLHGDLKNFHARTMQTKANVDSIVKHLKQWGSQPMYTRHDGVSNNLMMVEDFPAMILRRQMDCLESKKLIDLVMDANFRLFFNLKQRAQVKKSDMLAKQSDESVETKSTDELNATNSSDDRPSENDVGETDKAAQVSESHINLRGVRTPSTAASSISDMSVAGKKTVEQLTLFRPYEEYIDSIIWQEIQESLRISIKYIKLEMENRLEHDAPIFEVELELQSPNIVYIPKMDTSLSRPVGMLEIVTSMIANILNITDMIPLVAQPLNSSGDGQVETFAIFIEAAEGKGVPEIVEIENMHMDITALARDTIQEAIIFVQGFEKYSFLWQTDKKVYLRYFLRYGKILPHEDIAKLEEGTLEMTEQPPALGTFRQVIDFYAELYEEIDQYEKFMYFNSWLRVNMKGLKYRMLNEVCKWGWLFKRYLKEKVVNDLTELDNFIIQSTESLNLEATNEDSVTLLKILKTIGSIFDRERQTDNMFEPLKEIVDLLSSYDMSFEERVNNQFAELPENWITLKKLAIFVRVSIASVQAYQVDLIKSRIALFDTRTRLYHEKFLKMPFFSVPCPNVYDLCDVVNEELGEMEKQISGLRESAVHFQLSLPEEGRLIQCRKLIRMVKQVWDFLLIVSSCIDDWKMTAWKKINVDDMEVECKKFSKDMRNFDKETKSLKPFLETEAMIKNLLTSLRAIIELQNPAIRERHWIELMVATKVSFKPSRNSSSFIIKTFIKTVIRNFTI